MRVESMGQINDRLYQANIDLVDKNTLLEEDKAILQKRIKRAIDYIELIQYNESYGVKEKDYLQLLDILKGDAIVDER